MIPRSAVLEAVSRNAWTCLVLSPDGQVEELVTLPAEATAQTLLEVANTHARGRRFRLIQQAYLSEAQLDALILETTRPLAAARTEAGLASVVERFESGASSMGRMKVMVDALASWFARRLP